MTQKYPKLSVYIAISIDGYIARENGNLDWLETVALPDEDYGYSKFLESIDAIILGKNTYEVAAQPDEWPYKGKRSIVLSSTLKSVREDAQLYHGDLENLVLSLYKEGIRHVWVDGGKTISQFLELGLINTIILSIIPVILGTGIPLFQYIKKESFCRLVTTRSFRSGLAQLQYEVISR